MKLNLKGKLNYVSQLVGCYKNWYDVVGARLSKTPLNVVYLRNGLTICAGTKSLIVDLIDEIFINEVYNPKFLKIAPGDVVVDVGANIGVFSLYAAHNGASKIYSVEPFPKNTATIIKNFKINNLNEPTVIQAAVTDKRGTAKLYLGSLDSHALLFDNNHIQTFHKHISTPTITFKDFVDKNKINKIDFLKLDCEGSEGQILLSTPLNIWKHIKKVAIEYHNNTSALNSTQIVKKLNSFGYKTKIKKSDNLFGYIYAWR